MKEEDILGVDASVDDQTGWSEFKEPWKDSTTALVIDPYHENGLNFDQLATEPRVAGIIHKASEGLQTDGELYGTRRDEARRRGYKWGSYHLGRPHHPIRQADFYLATAQPTDDDLMALDLEDVTSSDMSLADAESFVSHIKQQTGRYPLVYVTGKVRDAITENYGSESVFAQAPLWYARYLRGNDITRFFPSRLWSTYTLWQFASEINCPSKDGLTCPFSVPIPGTGYDMDVNVFYGTVAELRSKWPFTFRESA